jgi:hypothetical protein
VKYVEFDERTGAIHWDEYFDYLKSVRTRLSEELYSYASDWGHYSLDGLNSLHDAWLLSVQFAFREKNVAIELLGARQDRKHVFEYKNVEAYSLDLAVNFRSGDRDVIAHEFRIEEELIVHEIIFADGKTIVVRSKDVEPRIEVVQ